MNHMPNCLTMLSSHYYFPASYQIYFYGPQWNNYTYRCFVQFMVFRYKMLLIQQICVCPSGKSHRYYSASQFIMQHPKVKNLALHFPFKKYHRSMYTVDLIEYIFTQIITVSIFFQLQKVFQLCTLVVMWKTLVT